MAAEVEPIVLHDGKEWTGNTVRTRCGRTVGRGQATGSWERVTCRPCQETYAHIKEVADFHGIEFNNTEDDEFVNDEEIEW